MRDKSLTYIKNMEKVFYTEDNETRVLMTEEPEGEIRTIKELPLYSDYLARGDTIEIDYRSDGWAYLKRIVKALPHYVIKFTPGDELKEREVLEALHRFYNLRLPGGPSLEIWRGSIILDLPPGQKKVELDDFLKENKNWTYLRTE